MSPCAAAREPSAGSRVRRHGESTAATRAPAPASDEQCTQDERLRVGRPRRRGCGCFCSAGFGLIFYQFVPKAETSVGYYPWFYEQVQADNIKSISIQGTEIRGELRKDQPYQSAPNQHAGHRSSGSSPTPLRKPRSTRSCRS